MADPRSRVLEAVGAPLGFFVLALLIVESFLAAVLIGANIDQQARMTGIWIGVGLFTVVTVMVFSLVWFRPMNIVFDKDAHIAAKGIITPPAESSSGPKQKVRRPKKVLASADDRKRNENP